MSNKAISPEGWLPAKGYANGVLNHRGTLYTGGQIGWNAAQQFEAKDFVGQLEQALANIVAIVEAAGGEIADIVRLTWFITDKKAYTQNLPEIGKAYRRVMGRHFPAMSVIVVTALIEDEALVEIEATAEIGEKHG